jgi:hypothetical protein
MGPRAILDTVKREIPSPCWELNSKTLIIQPIAQHYKKIPPFVCTDMKVGLLPQGKNRELVCLGNRVLRREVTGGWRNLHKEEIHNLYSSPHKSLWRMRCVGAKSTHNINFHWKT